MAPIKPRSFSAAANSSAVSAPTMKVRDPAVAALTPPETGASTNWRRKRRGRRGGRMAGAGG